MRNFTLSLLAIAILSPSVDAQDKSIPIPDRRVQPLALPVKFNQPRQDLEQLRRQYAPQGQQNPIFGQPPQIRQGLQRNSYIEGTPNLPTRTEVELIPRSGTLAPPLRTRYPSGTTPTLKETESRIVRRLCTEYKRGLTPGELDELAHNLVEKNRLYLGGESKSPYGYAIQARNTKKC